LQIEGIDMPYEGKVVEINPVATRDTKKYQVKIAVDNSGNILKKGMYTKVKVESGKKETYAVPKSAIVVRDLFSYIFLVEDGEAKEVKIERGYADGELVEVISAELQGKLELVVDGQYILSNKDKVNIQK
ncbi:MAG: efflux RND transporter periplasmic adaptor subunit, partial [Fusobacteriaceae bacterium]